MQTDEILSALEEDIVFGVLSPKSRLVEERLTARFNTKRHVIREVFSALENLGLVERIPNKGAILVEFKPAEVLHIYEVRQMLEKQASATTPLPSTHELLTQMEDIHSRQEEAVYEGRFREVFHLNVSFHRLQYSACPNKHLLKTIHDYARKTHIISTVKLGDQNHMREVLIQHWKLIEAMRGNDNQKLVELISSHLSSLSDEYIHSYNIRNGLDQPE